MELNLPVWSGMKNRLSPLARPGIIPVLLTILLTGWLYWPTLTHLFRRLAHSEDYSFGLLLPVISGYIVYLNWPELKGRAWRPSRWGLLVLALGLGLHLGGELAADFYTSSLSLVVVAAGLIWLRGGWPLVRFLAFPLFLLFIMVPLPAYVLSQLTHPLQLLSSRLAAFLLQFLGVPVIRQGNILDLGVRQLHVAAGCSGLRYVFPLLAFGLVYCYFFQRRPLKAAILLASLLPIAIIANAFRIAGMAVVPPEIPQEPLHSLLGWLTYVFCLGFLVLLNRLLTLRQPASPAAPRLKAPPAAPPDGQPAPRYSWPGALILLILALPAAQLAARVPAIPLARGFEQFPLQIGPWQGHWAPLELDLNRSSQGDARLDLDFSAPGQAPVNLWITYQESQKRGGALHSPLSCVVGSGWAVVAAGTLRLGPARPVKFMLLEQAGARVLVFYWYLQRGRWLTNEYLNRLYLGYDTLVKHRSDGALVRLTTVGDGDLETALNRLISFSSLLVPVLPQFITP